MPSAPGSLKSETAAAAQGQQTLPSGGCRTLPAASRALPPCADPPRRLLLYRRPHRLHRVLRARAVIGAWRSQLSTNVHIACWLYPCRAHGPGVHPASPAPAPPHPAPRQPRSTHLGPPGPLRISGVSSSLVPHSWQVRILGPRRRWRLPLLHSGREGAICSSCCRLCNWRPHAICWPRRGFAVPRSKGTAPMCASDCSL